MIRTLTLLLFISFIGVSATKSQSCNPSIPSTVTVLTTSSTAALTKMVWVCPGVSYATNSNGKRIYLEPGAIFDGKNSIRDTVFVKKTATVTFATNALAPVIVFEDSASILITPTSAVLVYCPSLVFDYSGAPSPGCPAPTNVTSITTLSTFFVFPNPSAGAFTISVDESLTNATLNISNMLGATVYSEMITGKQKTINSNLSAGIYFVQVSNSNGRQWMQKVVIE